MSVLVNKDSKVIVQGITGGEGTFHASQMLQYGTNVVGGVTPGKGGTMYSGKGEDIFTRPVPVFNTVSEAVGETGADVSIIFVPAPFAADAILESIDGGIGVIICITEGIPVKDMIPVKEALDRSGAVLIGNRIARASLLRMKPRSASCQATSSRAVPSVSCPAPER